jgi:predicted enzyme related to lactoylglutathione lyase
MLNVSEIKLARTFYIDQLEMPVIEEYPTMFAFRAGQVRFTVVGGGTHRDPDMDGPDPPATIMFRSTDIESDVVELRTRGVKFLGDIEEAPGFMRHIALLDPDNNYVYIAQYFRDPLLAE